MKGNADIHDVSNFFQIGMNPDDIEASQGTMPEGENAMTATAINRLYARLRRAGIDRATAWELIEIAASMALFGRVDATVGA